jgi:hypothetical protein
VVDSEVDETTRAGYHGVNLWQATRGGGVTGTGTTVAYSREPTGLGYDPGTNTLFISDDGKKRSGWSSRSRMVASGLPTTS